MQIGLIMILLSQPLLQWNYRCGPPRPISVAGRLHPGFQGRHGMWHYRWILVLTMQELRPPSYLPNPGRDIGNCIKSNHAFNKLFSV